MGISHLCNRQMYKSTYLSVRIHTEDEAMEIQPSGDADIFLWLIDVYDLGQSEKCAKGIKKLIMSKYFDMNERVPGMLPRWTKGMMAWTAYLNALVPNFEHDEKWVIQHNLMVEKNPEQWSVQTLLTTLDAVAMRWHKAHTLNRQKLNKYLHCIWSCAKKWTMNLHDHIPNGLKEGDKYKLHPKHIMACFSRFFWFHKTLDMRDNFQPVSYEVPDCTFFFKNELRHFVLRKFRDQLLKDVWNTVPFYGDLEIAGHDQLGDYISTYSAVYKRHPVCLLQRIQQRVLYDEPVDVRKYHQDATDIKIIQTYFQNNFKIDFAKYFLCFERNCPKHLEAIRNSVVPVIFESFKQFFVAYEGSTYGPGSIAEVFPIWVKLAKKPHGLNISELSNKLFVKNSTTTREGIYELSV